ncbi:MAG: fused MFS/spermidine synthase [bacterium]
MAKKKNRNKKKNRECIPTGIFSFMLLSFFLSGLSGLIYEILWTRMMVKIIGSAPFAVSIILTVFMGGLGLGSYLASHIIDRFKEPLALVRLYGALELLIGAYAVLVPLLIMAFKPLQIILYNALYTHFIMYNLFTFIICALILGVPIICMGATLPILCRFYVARLSHLGTNVGRMYGLNNIGAAVGALLCGFWLISLWGIWGTLTFAVGINVAIGLVCLKLSNKVRLPDAVKDLKTPDSDKKSYDNQAANSSPVSLFERNAALVIFAVSGFCAMAVEVIWTRLLGLIVGPTTYSFTIVLVTFIIGLACGNLIFGYLADRIKNCLWLLLISQIAAALLVLGISQVLGNSQFFFAKLIFHFKDQFALLSVFKASVLFMFILLPTVCFGAGFPLVGKLYTRSVNEVGQSIGFAYMLNTVGSLLGPFCAGFVLIPLVGKEVSIRVVVGLQLATVLAIAGVLLWKSRKDVFRFGILAAPLLAGLVLCMYYPSWNHSQLAMGKYYRFDQTKVALSHTGWLESLVRGPSILERIEKGKLVYYGDGIGGFTTVVKYANALGTTKYCMANSGKPDATSHGDMGTQTISAHFPMLFHKNPKTVMVVGLASGVTAGEVLWYPAEKLDLLEINDQVVAASSFFEPWNNHVLSDPRTRLIIQDARAHLELTEQSYDVIISEPSNPWMAGLASLFTHDYFELVKDRLTDEGIFVQWMQAYQMDWETFAMVGRTFAHVFPHSLLINTEPAAGEADYLLVGFKGKDRLNLKYADLKRSYARESKNVTLTDPRLLYRMIVSENLPMLFGPGNIHSDSRPHLEFSAPKLMYDNNPKKQIYRNIHDKRWTSLSADTKNIIQQIESDTASQIDFASFALSINCLSGGMVDLTHATASQKERIFKLMEGYCIENEVDYSVFENEELEKYCLSLQIDLLQNKIDLLPDKELSYSYLGTLYNLAGRLSEASMYYEKALQINPYSATIHNNCGVVLTKQKRYNEAISHYREALRLDHEYRKARNNLEYTLAQQGTQDSPINPYTESLPENPGQAEDHYKVGLALANQNRLDEAIGKFSEALRINPSYVEAYCDLGVALSKQGRLDEAIYNYSKAVHINPEYSEAHFKLGIVLAHQGRLDEAIHHYAETVRINPNYKEAYNDLGVALTRQGRLNDAIRNFSQALHLNAGYADAHNNLGIALARKGKLEEAEAHFREALRIKPDYKGARRNLRRTIALREK